MGLIASLFNFGKQTQIGTQINYESINEEQLQTMFNELKGRISTDYGHMQTSVQKTIESVLVSNVSKMVVEAYKEHCKISPDSQLILSIEKLQGIVNENNGIISNIQDIFEKDNDNLKEIKKELKELQKDIKLEIKNLCALCENILYWSRETHKLCKQMSDELSLSKKQQDNLINQFAQYMELAELRHKELMAALVKTNDEKQLASPQLDLGVIAEMHEWIKNIPTQIQDQKTDFDSIVAIHASELDNRIKEINHVIDYIATNSELVLEKVISIDKNVIATRKDILQEIENLQRKIDNLCSQQTVLDEYSVRIDSEKSREEIEKLKAERDELQSKLSQTIRELEIKKSDGNLFDGSCPYCGYETQRDLVGGKCECKICGHRFTAINPDMHDVSDEQVKHDWKALHTATLEKVSEDVHDGLYRMQLDQYTVSSAGVLIIPDEDNARRKITEVAFCQPNTDDKDGKGRLSKVKTLLLADGIKLSTFHGIYPFSEIMGLERVMRYKKNYSVEGKETFQTVEDEEISNKIKGYRR